ncbi:MAG: hypothetical protein K2K73_01875 [Ureaplasma sp.]|nr:hypothetical protein [Ureaplasma sp.]
MEPIKQEKEFQIDKLIKVLSSSSKEFIILSAIPDEKSNSIVSSIINICVDHNRIPNWTSLGSINSNDCALDIRNVIFNNLDDKLLKDNNESFYKRKILAPKIKKKVDKLYRYKVNYSEEIIKNNKNVIWPVLTTISSFGVALGVPMFSTLLLRQNEIINGAENNAGALGEKFFIAFLTISIIFIIASIIAMFVSLANTIKKNRKDYVTNLLYLEFEKIIDKYFYSKNENNEKAKYRKFRFQEKYIFFYSDLDVNSPNYVEHLHLLNVLSKMNCQCVLVFDEKITDDKAKIVYKGIIDPLKTEIISFDKYKNSANIKSLINFIIYQVTLISGLSGNNLMRNHSLFINGLYRFVDLSTSNEQLLKLIESLKIIIGKNKNIKIDQKFIPYFVHLFILCIIKSLNIELYENIYYDLSTTGILSDKVLENNLAQTLRLQDVFNKNFNIYNQFALYFEFINFFDEIENLRELILHSQHSKYDVKLTDDEWFEKINKLFKNKGYQEVENKYPEWFDYAVSMNDSDTLYIKRIKNIDKEKTFTLEVNSLLEKAKKVSIDYLIIIVFEHRLTYQLTDNKYELLTDFLI